MFSGEMDQNSAYLDIQSGSGGTEAQDWAEMIQLDENGDFRSIARDVIVELRLITHLRKPYIEDRELLTFEKEDMRRRSNLHEAAERQADGRDDNHVWD